MAFVSLDVNRDVTGIFDISLDPAAPSSYAEVANAARATPGVRRAKCNP